MYLLNNSCVFIAGDVVGMMGHYFVWVLLSHIDCQLAMGWNVQVGYFQGSVILQYFNRHPY